MEQLMMIQEICAQFNIDGKFVKAKMLHTGIINNTYKVQFNNNGKIEEYIVQKINKNVFKKPALVMNNIHRICLHIINKLKNNYIDSERSVLHYMVTENNYSYYIDADQEYWRCYRFISNSISFDNTDDLFIIEQAGSAFGQFQSMLSDFDAKSLHESIVNFHNTKQRFLDLFDSVDLDVASRVENATAEIEYLKSMASSCYTLGEMINNKELPLRVTHNDTKCNNVLFDKITKKALAVIDLDTVMPGLVAYDFGDAIRCIAATCAEDEKDLSKVQIDMCKLEAFTKGFLSASKSTLTENELNSLALGIPTITLELASRFLKDYLDGDIYFKISYDEHNLVRAKCQIELAKEFLENFDQIKQIIKKYC